MHRSDTPTRDAGPRPPTPGPFHGWRVVRTAFVIAFFGWGVGFYGPPVFLHAIHQERGWPVSLISLGVTLHFLVGALVVAHLARLHGRFGLVAVTRWGGLASAFGVLGWALAAEPWQLFAATLMSGLGWATTSGAAINAMLSPWFLRRRPAALAMAYNGASVGGVVLSPLWVALIAWHGLAGAALLVGSVMALVLWWLAGRSLGRLPAELGQAPDGDQAGTIPGGSTRPAAKLDASPWRDRRFATLACGTMLSLFAQIGLIAHLFSLMAPLLGVSLAAIASGMATACAILGRTALGWLLPPDADRRIAGSANALLQAIGSLLLLAGFAGDAALLLAGVALFGLGLGNATSLPPLIAQQDFAPSDTARVVPLVTALSQAAFAFAPLAFGLLRGASAQDATLPCLAAAALQIAASFVLQWGRRRIAPCNPI